MPQEDMKKFDLAYKMFEKTGAILKGPGHFVYAYGDHGVIYIDKNKIFKDSTQTSILCEQIAEHFKNSDIDTVAGPESGGIIMANWVAMHSSRLREKKVDVIHLLKKDSFLTISRNEEEKIVGKKILLVDDIATTGSSLNNCVQAINRNLGGSVVGIGLLWLRGGESKILELFQGISFFSLIKVMLEGWSEEQCTETGPCARGVPINTEYGYGADFIRKNPQYCQV